MKTSFTFRIEIEDLEKLRYIAEKNRRTVSNLITYSVQRVIANYDKKHGEIGGQQRPKRKPAGLRRVL